MFIQMIKVPNLFSIQISQKYYNKVGTLNKLKIEQKMLYNMLVNLFHLLDLQMLQKNHFMVLNKSQGQMQIFVQHKCHINQQIMQEHK